MKKITEVRKNGRTFIIARDEAKRYWAFEDKFVAPDGHLLKEFNGITGMIDMKLDVVICRVTNLIVYDKLISEGYDQQEVFKKIYMEGV